MNISIVIRTKILNKILIFFTFLIIVLYPLHKAWSEWPEEEIDIELVRCQPNGYIPRAVEKWDQKSFWVKQVVSLESVLREEDMKFYMQICDNEEDKAEKTRCKYYYINRHKAIVKCLKYSKTMCREYGGLCE